MARRETQGRTLVVSLLALSTVVLGGCRRNAATEQRDASGPATIIVDAGAAVHHSDAGLFGEHADLYRRAIEQLGHADYAAAEGTYKELVTLEPDKAAPYFGLAGVLMKQQRYKEAKPLYEKALAIEPRSLPALHGLGNVALQSGDFAGALSYFDRALEIDPKDGQCLFGAAKAQVDMGHCQEAGKYSARALKGARAGAPPAAWNELQKSCREGKPPLPSASADAGAVPRPTTH